jgi:hypothetical protein
MISQGKNGLSQIYLKDNFRIALAEAERKIFFLSLAEAAGLLTELVH